MSGGILGVGERHACLRKPICCLLPANRDGGRASAKSDERQGNEADQRSSPASRMI
jgi:hypothetical protein